MYDVIVVGAGAAGLLASAEAGRRGLRVLLCERNRFPGAKLRITGKGRCNLTNDCGIREALDNIPTGSNFLQSAFNALPPKSAMELFESLGLPLKTERGGRVFPVSDRASDVVGALLRYARESGVATVRCRVTGLELSGGAVSGAVAGDRRIPCRSAVLCTGGMSYPQTGSTGDGYAIAERLGHTIMPIRPSLVPLVARGEMCARLEGLSLKNVRLAIHRVGKRGAKTIFDEMGELLFTHFGISGPLTLSASAHMGDFCDDSYTAVIDMKPALDEDKLDARILRDFAENANRDFVQMLRRLVPARMAPVIADAAGIPPNTKVHSVTRGQRAALRIALKRLTFEITGSRPIQEAVITSGGIKLSEIDPKTMQSKLVRGLHFAGEIIDADAYTGGFNLQIAWSTACAAGRNVLGARAFPGI
ncbi:MAG: NAD(P)/FAD-dependent oxidoreductase [Oscillospiraceae bacterium]|jgi:predicted Rossmann fold flavoprotein|nr:NAD(P)/FAD-dependent oxidoreductase [Oscillospiraceae bacterium]